MTRRLFLFRDKDLRQPMRCPGGLSTWGVNRPPMHAAVDNYGLMLEFSPELSFDRP